MRRIVTTALLALLLMVEQQTQAADPSVITLSCDGTVTDTTSASRIPIDREPKLVEKMGVVANLNERTVSFMGWVAPISSADAAS